MRFCFKENNNETPSGYPWCPEERAIVMKYPPGIPGCPEERAIIMKGIETWR